MKNIFYFLFGFFFVFFSFFFASVSHAVYPGDCTFTLRVAEGYNRTYDFNNQYVWHCSVSSIDSLGNFDPGAVACVWEAMTGRVYSFESSYRQLKSYYSEGGEWILQDTLNIGDSSTPYWYYESQYNDIMSIPDVLPESCPVTCPASGDDAGDVVIMGRFVPEPYCEGGCVITSDSLSLSACAHLAGEEDDPCQWMTFVYDGSYTGEECAGDEEPVSPDTPEEIPCDEYISKCEELCRDGGIDVSCDETERHCDCDLPAPFPLIDVDGEIQPDQDDDGIPSGSDTDVDGDQAPNGVDNDVDGDSVNNAGDPDVDGDGIGNGGDTTSWTPDAGSDDGSGCDPDIDGDGIPNAGDPDMDGDGIANPYDDDIDGDGILNADDADSNCDGILDGGGTLDPNLDPSLSDDPPPAIEPVEPVDTDNDDIDDLVPFEPGDVNFQPLVNSAKLMRSHFPFNVIDSLPVAFGQFQATRTAPVFDITILGLGEIRIDLAMFDPVMSIIRGMLSLLLFVGTSLSIIKLFTN